MSFPSKYPSKCVTCRDRIEVGELINWNPQTKEVYHDGDCTPKELKSSYGSRGSRGNRRSHSDSSNDDRDGSSDESTSSTTYSTPSTRLVSLTRPVNGIASTGVNVKGSGPKICICAFNRPIAEEMQRRLAITELIPGSDEQEAIWQEMLEGRSNIIVNASAGTGKSFVIQQGVLRMVQAMDASAIANTYHSLGMSILRSHFKPRVNKNKLWDIIDQIKRPFGMGESQWSNITQVAHKLVGIAKNYLVDGGDKERLEELADHHAIDLVGNGVGDTALILVPQIIEACLKDTQTVDFDDMVWMPVSLSLQGPSYDLVISDESQDMNIVQQKLTFLVCASGGRMIVVGDRNQNINGWRGADIASIETMKAAMTVSERGVKEFPLTITRRCAKSHVRMAQHIVGDVIRPLEDAPEGHIITMSKRAAVQALRPGDMAICRVNKELVPIAYELIKRGIKAIVRGRDIGTGLEALIKKVGSPEHVDTLLDRVSEFEAKEVARLSKQKYSDGKIGALQDKCDTLRELCEGLDDTAQVLTKIETIFADFKEDGKPVNAVVLSSCHRGKGLEAERVFVLAPELMPHPMAQRDWEHVQESNLAYIACTRSKAVKGNDESGVLVFVGPIPAIYGMNDDGMNKE